MTYGISEEQSLIVVIQEKPVAELIAATGHGRLGGFTLFQVGPTRYQFSASLSLVNDRLQKDLPTRMKRKVHAVGGARGVWSLPIRQPLRTNGSHMPAHPDTDSIIISTDINPSPGLTRVRISIL